MTCTQEVPTVVGVSDKIMT